MIVRTLTERGLTIPSRATIGRWARRESSPLANLNTFTPVPSEKLSFFIGAWYGDGWADESDGGKRMRLKVRSESFAQEFADAATGILRKSTTYRVWLTRRGPGLWFNVKVTSKLLFDFLGQEFSSLIPSIEPFSHGFLRGLYTAEGNPSVSVEHSPRPWLGIGIEVSNNDLVLLRTASEFLRRDGFSPGKIRLNAARGKRTNVGIARSDGWKMSLSRLADVTKFAQEIGFADKAKQKKLIEGCSLVSRYGRYEAAAEWVRRYGKVGHKWTRKDSPVSASS